MPVSNIDDLLLGGQGNSQQPKTPEYDSQQEMEPIEEDLPETNEYLDNEQEPAPDEEYDNQDESEDHQPEQKEQKKEIEVDEYGNEKERMPKGMKERFDRKDKQHQKEIEQREYEIQQLRAQLANSGASQEVQQAAKDFEYDPNESGDWQQQLKSFIKQTVSSMSHEESERQSRQKEASIQQEFETKLRKGMGQFGDFVEVMTNLPFEITNPMTLATRGMENPAAFLYAAAKRNPGELERISKMRDPYAQMTEIGKLEERMRKNRPTTKAPRPLGRTTEDATVAEAPKKQELTGDDLLARADAKRIATVKNRLRNNR
jgi:hypothetical protein